MFASEKLQSNCQLCIFVSKSSEVFYQKFKKFFVIKVLLFFAGLYLAVQLPAQSELTFTASTNAKQVLLNGQFEVYFTLKNANGTNFTPPSFKDFIIMAGPNASNSMQIVNGRVSREMSYSFTLQPAKVGNFTIGSASIRANGKKMTTEPLSIEVLRANAAGQARGSEAEEVFLQLEVNKTEAYLGEQIILDLKLYTSLQIEGYDIPEEPDYQGFFAQEIMRPASNTLQEVVNGKQYTTVILRRIALYPQQTGVQTIQPMGIYLAAVEDKDRNRSIFYRNTQTIQYTTNSLSIEVKPLPPNAPAGFNGAVGKLDFQASADRKVATTDEAVSILLLISGKGDVKRIQPPPLVLSDSFEVYAPKVVEDKMEEYQGDILAKKTIEYLVLPKYPGFYTIAPSFTYFDTESGRYVTLGAGPFPLSVRQGTDRHEAKKTTEEDAGQVLSDIRFIKSSASLKQKGADFVGSPVFWSLTALPLAAFLGIFFFRKMQDKQKGTDMGLLKSRQAGKEARKRLSKARELLSAADSRAFYDEVSKAALGYVCDKLSIPLSQLTRENITEKLQSLKVSASLIEDFEKIIQTCEMALFAGMDNSEDMQSIYERAIAVISGIEGELGQ